MATVFSYCQSNISLSMRRAQREVFQHFDIKIEQVVDDRRSHGEWMRWILEQHSDNEIVTIADIDAFPLRASAVQDLLGFADRDMVAGLAQVANHKDPGRVYAGPMFIALKAGVYRRLGSPTLKRWANGDVGQIITDLAIEKNIPIHLIPPKFALVPKWNFAGLGVFGVGTFYGDLDFFHLFESRNEAHELLFAAVARGAICNRHDFAEYLELAMPRSEPAPVAKSSSSWRLFRR
jgi:hypothetical protein